MRKQLLPMTVIILIILIAALLTLVARDVMDEALATPLLYLFWLGRIVFLSVPQQFIWGLFLIAAVIITGRNLSIRQRRSKAKPPPSPEDSERIEAWLTLIRQAHHETYYKWQLAQRLRRLILDALAHEARLTRKQVRRRLADNRLDLPPDIQAYLQTSRISFGRLAAPKRRFFGPNQPASPLDLEPDRIAQFLEERFKR